MRARLLAAILLAGLALGVTVGSAGTTGGVTFVATFDDGTLGSFQYQQCAPTTRSKQPTYRGTFSYVTAPVGQGRGALKLTVPRTPAGWPLTSCGLLTPLAPFGLGRDEYIGLMLYEPRGWTIPNTAFYGVNIYELHTQYVWGAPVILQLHTDNVTIALETGACNDSHTAHPGCVVRSNSGLPPCHERGLTCLPAEYAIPPGKLVAGQWNEIVLHARWAADRTGYLHAYYRVKGARAWSSASVVQGVPTVQWSNRHSGPSGLQGDGLMVYTARVSAPFSLYMDNAVDGNSLAAVEGAMP